MESHCVVFILLVLMLIQSVRPWGVRRGVNGETDHGPGWEEWKLECQLLLWASLVAQSVKNLPAMQENWTGFDSWVGKVPWRRKRNPLLPGESHEQRSLAGCSPWRRKSRTQLDDYTTISCSQTNYWSHAIPIKIPTRRKCVSKQNDPRVYLIKIDKKAQLRNTIKSMHRNFPY